MVCTAGFPAGPLTMLCDIDDRKVAAAQTVGRFPAPLCRTATPLQAALQAFRAADGLPAVGRGGD